jgi:hypothetical protein
MRTGKKMADYLIARHRKPWGEKWIRCCRRSGVKGKKKKKKMERVKEKHVSQHQVLTAFTKVGIPLNLAE